MDLKNNIMESKFYEITENSNYSYKCQECPISKDCYQFVNRINGQIYYDKFIEPYHASRVEIQIASTCSRAWPKYMVKRIAKNDYTELVANHTNQKIGNDIISDYRITKDNYKNIYKLDFGYIIKCNLGENFGIVYGIIEDQTSHEYEMLYYFEKDINYSLTALSVISFVRVYDDYTKKEDIKITDITSLDDYIILDDSNKTNSTLREDNLYHSDFVWLNMKHLKKMIITCGNSVTVYYPYLSHEEKNIYYLTKVFNSVDKPNDILTYFINLKELDLYKNGLPFEISANVINSIVTKVSTTDIASISNLFEVRDYGYFLYKPGGDDMFIRYKKRLSECNDVYINNLTTLGVADKDYNSCVGRGIGDDEYDNLNEEETTKIRKEVLSRYNKNEHLQFLLNDFLTNISEKHKMYSLYKTKLVSQGNPKKIELYINSNLDLNSWITMINEHKRYHK